MDAHTDHIAFCNYDGSGHHIVLMGSKLIEHPFAMSLFENYVYWSDWEKKRVIRVEKLHGWNATVLHTDSSFLSMDLHTVHPLRQPPGSVIVNSMLLPSCFFNLIVIIVNVFSLS